MNYTARLTVPALTPATAPVATVIRPTVKRLTGGRVLFPRGVHSLTFIRIRDRGFQLYPDLGAWATGDNDTLTFQVNRRLDGPPSEIWIEGYSDDDTYPHTITVSLDAQ